MMGVSCVTPPNTSPRLAGDSPAKRDAVRSEPTKPPAARTVLASSPIGCVRAQERPGFGGSKPPGTQALLA